MSNLTLTSKEGGDFKPYPEGIHPAICVDLMDLGLVETEFQGQKKMVNKVKLTFEPEAQAEDGKACTVSKNFTASLHPKAKLAEFLVKWRGQSVLCATAGHEENHPAASGFHPCCEATL